MHKKYKECVEQISREVMICINTESHIMPKPALIADKTLDYMILRKTNWATQAVISLSLRNLSNGIKDEMYARAQQEGLDNG